MKSEDDVALVESLLRNMVHAPATGIRDADFVPEVLATRGSRSAPARRDNGVLRNLSAVDESRFTVRWNGSECHLGSAIPYRLLCAATVTPVHAQV